MSKKLEIGLRLKDFAERKFPSLADFSRELGLSTRQQVYDYVKGKSYPGGELLSKIADLGCDINWLLTGKGNTVMFKEEQTTYNPQQVTIIEFIKILLDENNICGADFAAMLNISQNTLDSYFANRNIPHEVFTSIVETIKNNKDKFIKDFGINLEALKQDEYVSIHLSDSPIQISNQNSDEGGVQLANLNKSSIGDISEINKSIDSKLVNKLIKNYDEQIKFLQDTILDKRTIISEQKTKIEAQQITIDELRTKLMEFANQK